MRWLARVDLPRLFQALSEDGRRVVGPRVRDHAIVLDELDSADQLPTGWTDAQGPGRYRIAKGQDASDGHTFTGYVVGPDSLKPHLFPAREVLYGATRRPDGKLGFTPLADSAPPTAHLGVRACDLAAAEVQDRTFLGAHPDPRYRARREATTLVAVNCTEPGELCFCASTNTGPRVRHGADVVLTERDDGFYVEAQSEAGRAILDALPTQETHSEDAAWVDRTMAEAATKMGRAMDTRELPRLLFGRLGHARWDQVAERCLACGNCTHVCPTCFCSTTEDPSSLDAREAEHVRLWDSCFTAEHAMIHGASFRPTTHDRYRQWLTHKVGAWVSQFGTSGCVGCGRCIAWCPVGIDLTEEIAALREGEGMAPMPAPPSVTESHDEALVPREAEVVAVERESGEVVTLHVRAPGLEGYRCGQFCQLSLPGIGEAPISISGHDGAAVEHTIRAVGHLTRALTALKPGDRLGLRGPYGHGWPLEALKGRPVVVVAGGIGLAPLRGALREMLGHPHEFPDVRLIYGARTPEDALYVREMLGWLELPGFSLQLTVDRATPAWRGHVGVVTRLIDRKSVPADASALLCGPETMMRFTIDALTKVGLAKDGIWLTMERHMKCATGTCGRCQFGPWFVCKDGPVFRYDDIAMLFGEHGY